MLRTVLAPVLFLCLGACAGSVPTPTPDADEDGDGVAISVDRCPSEPEDVDRFADEDGCPEADNDADGRPDVEDVCPDEPEDVDGFQDADGCLEPDNDADHIPDPVDVCPCTAEVYNGYEDEDGCADCGRVLLIDTRIQILERIFFARRSAVVDARSLPILDAIAAVMRANSTIRSVRVAGYASFDEPGAPALGEARARAVMELLLARGVEPERLVAVSFGAERPLDPRRSRQANELNRRVEFEIVDPVDGRLPSACTTPPPVPDCTGR